MTTVWKRTDLGTCHGKLCGGQGRPHERTDHCYDWMPAPTPIEASLPYDSEVPTSTQPAFHAVVHLVIPCVDSHGTPVRTVDEACDYVSETLRGQFLDWGYVVAIDPETGDPLEGEGRHQSPIPITVCDPYVEGTFLDD